MPEGLVQRIISRNIAAIPYPAFTTSKVMVERSKRNQSVGNSHVATIA